MSDSPRFPMHYVPRPYQQELHRLWRKNRIGIAVLPRQSGKDVSMSMEQIHYMLKTPKTTGVYVAPDRPSVKEILWDKTYRDPVSEQYLQLLQDNVHPSLVSWKNTDLEGRFQNKSVMKLKGYYQSGRDANGVGTSYQQYAFTELSLFTREDPIPRIRPILSVETEQKRLMAVATPRGKRNNPLWQLMKEVEGTKDAFVIVRTIDDLNEMMRRQGLPPVRSQESLEQDKEAYLRRFGNSRMFEQEFYCSFEEMDAAAVYGEALSRLQAEHRDRRFNLDPNHPVYVAFDIGSSGKHSDATAWIAFQWFNNKLFLFDCGEGHGMALPEYVDILQTKPWFNKLACIILPWDGDHHEVSVNTTPADMMRQRFPNVAVLAKGTNIWKVSGLPTGENADLITMVQQVRMALYNTYINGRTEEEKKELAWAGEPNCDWILECMEQYKYAYNAAQQQWSEYPVHDKYSHIMDALRYVVQATKELDFFQGNLYNPNATSNTESYTDDWKDYWNG